ncbi:MAG: class I SAM-dependent rRNA methyltransferase [Bacteroidota bacterium]
MASAGNAHLILKPGRQKSILRKHCWIFSGAIKKTIGQPIDGDYIDVLDSDQNYLCSGHYQNGSICLRVISYRQDYSEAEAIRENILEAILLRRRAGFWDDLLTNAFRLVHGEGDRLPGLIIDYYAGRVVLQPHSFGMLRAAVMIGELLLQIPDIGVQSVFVKPKTGNQESDKPFYVGFKGPADDTVVEGGHDFYVNWETGQKTGFFLDQRDNRALLKELSKDQTVLNTFSYSGGFSVYALAGGARLVHSVDASAKAIDWTNKNVEALGEKANQHQAYVDDVMRFLKQATIDYDIVVLDPPAYAKNIKSRHRAVQGYKRLNMEGIKKVRPGGLLLTFSCSQVVDRELFKNTVLAAALESGRDIRILKSLEQGGDHPVNIYHQEGAYLKGLLLYVGDSNMNSV